MANDHDDVKKNSRNAFDELEQETSRFGSGTPFTMDDIKGALGNADPAPMPNINEPGPTIELDGQTVTLDPTKDEMNQTGETPTINIDGKDVPLTPAPMPGTEMGLEEGSSSNNTPQQPQSSQLNQAPFSETPPSELQTSGAPEGKFGITVLSTGDFIMDNHPVLGSVGISLMGNKATVPGGGEETRLTVNKDPGDISSFYEKVHAIQGSHSPDVGGQALKSGDTSPSITMGEDGSIVMAREGQVILMEPMDDGNMKITTGDPNYAYISEGTLPLPQTLDQAQNMQADQTNPAPATELGNTGITLDTPKM